MLSVAPTGRAVNHQGVLRTWKRLESFGGFMNRSPMQWGLHQPVVASLKGERKFTYREAQSAFGKVALRIWCLLAGIRNEGWRAHPSRAGIARKLKISEASVARGLRRLQAAGVVIYRGRLWYTFEGHYGPRDVRCATWKVLGLFVSDGTGWLEPSVWIPEELLHRVRKLKSHGGRRQGAGRKPTQTLGKNQSASPIDLRSKTLAFHSYFVGAKTQNRARVPHAREVFSNFTDGERVVMLDSADGVVDLGNARCCPPDSPFWAWLSKTTGYTAARELPTLLYPAPPRLDPNADRRDSAKQLARYFREVMRRRGYKTAFPFRSPHKSRAWSKLLKAVDAMLEHDIRPVLWARWSIDQWMRDNPGKKPPMPWVFAPGRIRKFRGWFRSEVGHIQHQTYKTDWRHTELCRREAAMVADFRQLFPSTNSDTARAIMHHHFPEGYGIALRALAEYVAQEQEEIDHDVARGNLLAGW